MDQRSPDPGRTALVILAVLGVMAALHLMKVILIPVALALFLACLLAPLTHLLRKILPVSATGAAILLFLILTSAGLVVSVMAAQSLHEAALQLPADAERLSGVISRQITQITAERPYLRGVLPDPGTIDRLGDMNRIELTTSLQGRLTDLGGWVGEGLMILVLVLFLLAESEKLGPKLIRFFAPAPAEARDAQRTLRLVIQKIQSYLGTRTLLNVGLGVAVTISLRLLGVGFAAPLGVFTALASFIPYIGQVISGALIVLVTLAQLGSMGDTLIVAAVYLVLVGIEGYVIMPYVMGRSLDLNGTTVLLACMFWGFLWGLVGLLLAIPITVSVKLLCQHIRGMRRWAELMSRDWPVAPPAPTHTPAPAPAETSGEAFALAENAPPASNPHA